MKGRNGGWYTYNDGTGMQTPAAMAPMVLPAVGGACGSRYAFKTTASNFTMWGAGIGTDLASMGTMKLPYNASAYQGVVFHAKAAAPLAVRFLRPRSSCDRIFVRRATRPPPRSPACSRARDELARAADAPHEAPVVVSSSAAIAPDAVTRRPARAESFLKCPTSGEVEAGDEITLRCVTSGSLRPASVVLFFKPPGRESFAAVPMARGDVARAKARGGVSGAAPGVASGATTTSTWTGKIPALGAGGGWVPFYFEARDHRGVAVALNGRDDSPNIITVRGGDRDGDGAHASLSASAAGGDGDADRDGDDPLAEINRTHALKRNPKRFWVSLGVGSGAGYASGGGVEAYAKYVRNFSPGLAHAGLLHLRPELGFFVRRTIALSLQGRDQFIARTSRVTAAGAHAVLARLLVFSSSEDALRFYGGIAAGAGEGFRLQVQAVTMDKKVIQDTVRGGPGIAGGGLGLSWNLGETWSASLELNALAGFPDFSAVLDADIGVRAAF